MPEPNEEPAATPPAAESPAVDANPAYVRPATVMPDAYIEICAIVRDGATVEDPFIVTNCKDLEFLQELLANWSQDRTFQEWDGHPNDNRHVQPVSRERHYVCIGYAFEGGRPDNNEGGALFTCRANTGNHPKGSLFFNVGLIADLLSRLDTVPCYRRSDYFPWAWSAAAVAAPKPPQEVYALARDLRASCIEPVADAAPAPDAPPVP